MEPPSSTLTDGKSKADPRSDDPLPCIFFFGQSLGDPLRKVPGILSCCFVNY